MSGRKSSVFSYPAHLKKDFLKTRDIVFRDGSRVTPEEVWEFMTTEAPRRFPYAFDASGNHIGKLSEDVEFFSGIKRSYLTLTLRDRMLNANNHGVPIVLIQGGQSIDPYYAAGGIPLRPGYVSQWARSMQEGMSLRDSELRGQDILESGRRKVSFEACHQISAHAAIDDKIVPVDLIAPYLCLRCSDMAYLTESHRGTNPALPTYFVDYPVDTGNREAAVEYVAESLRRLTKKVSELSGKEVTDEVLREEIGLQNRGRALAREMIQLWWDAEVPPTNSTDFFAIPFMANDFIADPVATVGVLEEMRDEIKDRVRRGVRGAGVHEDAVRIYVSGSCVGPNNDRVQRAGGVLVGRDDNWSSVVTEVRQEGDPYENLARAILSFPYELPTEERSKWLAGQVKESRADGTLFLYHWGCNYQTSISTMMADIVKERSGLPTASIELGELGRAEGLEQSENRIEAFVELLRARKFSAVA